ncbi:hypothetical protein, partial [Dysgonomonas sp. Marseille-P4677]|uniref:hypothetical protein n=1 Tax=Dysgonomonas sp. Marseille-P4677 TaxID=2364790 RepID=UPI001F1D2E01
PPFYKKKSFIHMKDFFCFIQITPKERAFYHAYFLVLRRYRKRINILAINNKDGLDQAALRIFIDTIS